MNINVVKYGIHVVTNGTNVNKQSSTKIKRSNYAGLKAWVQMNHRIMYCNSASRGLVGTSIWSDPCSRSSNKKIIFFLEVIRNWRDSTFDFILSMLNKSKGLKHDGAIYFSLEESNTRARYSPRAHMGKIFRYAE